MMKQICSLFSDYLWLTHSFSREATEELDDKTSMFLDLELVIKTFHFILQVEFIDSRVKGT